MSESPAKVYLRIFEKLEEARMQVLWNIPFSALMPQKHPIPLPPLQPMVQIYDLAIELASRYVEDLDDEGREIFQCLLDEWSGSWDDLFLCCQRLDSSAF